MKKHLIRTAVCIAAALGSGFDAGQPAFFETLADVNSDNHCNAEDASTILIQAAQQGAG